MLDNEKISEIFKRYFACAFVCLCASSCVSIESLDNRVNFENASMIPADKAKSLLKNELGALCSMGKCNNLKKGLDHPVSDNGMTLCQSWIDGGKCRFFTYEGTEFSLQSEASNNKVSYYVFLIELGKTSLLKDGAWVAVEMNSAQQATRIGEALVAAGATMSSRGQMPKGVTPASLIPPDEAQAFVKSTLETRLRMKAYSSLDKDIHLVGEEIHYCPYTDWSTPTWGGFTFRSCDKVSIRDCSARMEPNFDVVLGCSGLMITLGFPDLQSARKFEQAVSAMGG